MTTIIAASNTASSLVVAQHCSTPLWLSVPTIILSILCVIPLLFFDNKP